MMGAACLAFDLARTVAVRPGVLAAAATERWGKRRQFYLDGYAHFAADITVIEPEDCSWFWPSPVDLALEEWARDLWPQVEAEAEPAPEPKPVRMPWIPVLGHA